MPESSFDETADQIADLLVRVYEIHEIIIADTGGLSGLREPGLLHAAVARPFTTFQGRELYPFDFEKAAALFHSLIKSHPFMDGTKRTAFAAALFFLARCGHSLPSRFPVNQVIDFCVSIQEENLRESHGDDIKPADIADIAAWFQELLSNPKKGTP
jgi:death-on-curing protein